MATPARCWLVKSEPEVFSIDDFEREQTTGWEGVRSYEARNTMRDLMKQGEQVLFYHSNAKPSGIAGLAKVLGPPVADPTQFDPESEYFDPTSTVAAPRWQMVRLQFVARFPSVLPLERLRKERALSGMALLQKGQRLSVQPVRPEHFKHVVRLAKR